VTTSACPTCDHQVIAAGGRLLNPDRSRLGRYLPDGTELTPRQQADITIRGHHLHHCAKTPPPTNPAPTQDALF
jgi:hypothetical protein